MSARVGKNILLTQAGGGNFSIKQGDVLWVKASGAWLADAATKNTFLSISLSGGRVALADAARPLARRGARNALVVTAAAPRPRPRSLPTPPGAAWTFYAART
jgi:rhamnose utilization protein RhaD (predicted bifunctional aldolase and dehydrogenase)